MRTNVVTVIREGLQSRARVIRYLHDYDYSIQYKKLKVLRDTQAHLLSNMSAHTDQENQHSISSVDKFNEKRMSLGMASL